MFLRNKISKLKTILNIQFLYPLLEILERANTSLVMRYNSTILGFHFSQLSHPSKLPNICTAAQASRGTERGKYIYECVCIYVCMYMCMYTCIYLCMYITYVIYIYVCAYIYMYIYDTDNHCL